MTSHDIWRAANLASRIDVLSRGVIVASVFNQDLSPNQLADFYQQRPRKNTREATR
jgi:heme exporter protein A